jgi:MFS superfamily sulfate permease-like transporter
VESISNPGGGRGLPLNDIRSGFLVFLIALPLCLGIAMASGFPPIAGVLTAIVGGGVVSLLGSAELTIKGPAAGLIVIALGAVQDLGQGDLMLGYKRALAVGVIAALIQIAFALMRTATVGIAMSPAVVHGMLAAIGVIIISKQAHTMLGVAPEGSGPLELLAEIPRSVMHANPEILLIGVLSLLILFGWPLIGTRWARSVPPQLVVLLVAIPLDLLFDFAHPHEYAFMGSMYSVGPEYLVSLPGSLLDVVNFPDFSVITRMTSIKYVVMLALVGTIESTLSVLAVDAMDPKPQASNLNRDLLGVGIGNLICASIGGLPMISEIVRSRANIDAGATSRWSNLSHGVFLLAFVVLAPGLLQMIPLSALAAMLVYTGARLASPSEFAHTRKIGNDQLMLFLTTLIVTLATDLLVGVAVGLVLKVALHWLRGVSPRRLLSHRVEAGEEGEGVLRISIDGVAVFTTLLRVRRLLNAVGPSVRRVVIDVRGARLADHTFLSRLDAMAAELADAEFAIEGLDSMTASADHPHSTRLRREAMAS